MKDEELYEWEPWVGDTELRGTESRDRPEDQLRGLLITTELSVMVHVVVLTTVRYFSVRYYFVIKYGNVKYHK